MDYPKLAHLKQTILLKAKQIETTPDGGPEVTRLIERLDHETITVHEFAALYEKVESVAPELLSEALSQIGVTMVA